MVFLVRKEQVRMARVYKNNRYFFYGVTENKGFLSDLKMHIGRVPDWLFLSLAVRKKSSYFTHTVL